MPDLDLTWLRSSLANWHVYSVMLFPHDEERRQLLVEVLNAANLNEHFARSDVLVGGRIAGWMYEAPRFEDVINKEQWRYMDASISFVARALHHVLSAAANGHPEIASLAAAYKIEMAERAKAKTGGRKLDTLKNSWREYLCVAHLWLAFFKAPFDPFGRVGEGHPAVLGLWLACAEDLRRRGEAWKHRQRSKPFLDPSKTWKVPAGLKLPGVRVCINPAKLQIFKSQLG